MLSQRGAPAAEAAAKPKRERPVESSPEPPQARRKLSFKEKHALETLPRRMAALEAEIASLEAKLADPALFARDAQAFERGAARLAQARGELGAAEEEWLRLDLLKDEMAAG
jgi:ABC transport system ATP-binding/permease protein